MLIRDAGKQEPAAGRFRCLPFAEETATLRAVSLGAETIKQYRIYCFNKTAVIALRCINYTAFYRESTFDALAVAARPSAADGHDAMPLVDQFQAASKREFIQEPPCSSEN
ncbi:MAG: hypothetical protein PHY45_07910 [Rhodocyclaceae bacterium]|nr:hypothetical protein [Rhodocyclaceae bacterium]